jgi:hypothetical protein
MLPVRALIPQLFFQLSVKAISITSCMTSTGDIALQHIPFLVSDIQIPTTDSRTNVANSLVMESAWNTYNR